ncbi:hypothetical protein NP493_440g04048 [Ridgeia piscesae]|uniref:Uncharacterized protein n=1 Tax=Ridgeia piscesae TaxID=27915 RepID=A0AAD9L053_RIDPI|nr:hypothetical protein NP493_440g04048 [Ridgeia piscesae]
MPMSSSRRRANKAAAHKSRFITSVGSIGGSRRHVSDAQLTSSRCPRVDHSRIQRRSECHRQSNHSVDDCKVLRELSTTPPSGHLTRITSPVSAIAFQYPFPGGCSDCAE